MRRTIIRYVCLSFVLTMMSICAPVKKRFPSLSHLTESGQHLPTCIFCVIYMQFNVVL